MKRKPIALLSLLLAVAMLLSACELGTYKPAVSQPNQNIDGSSVVTTPTGGDDIENPYTATVTYQGQVYIPTVENPISVLWSDGYSVHEAPIGPDGIAKIGGLDGDYRVTLSNVPEGFAYNPNIYNADNENRHVEIELHQIIPTTGKGPDVDNCIKISSTGVYCITVKSAEEKTYFEFSPKQSGVYSVASWMDVAANEVNPTADYHGASFAYKPLVSTHDTGGPEGSYTKNFVMDVKIAKENISTNGTGAAVFTFGIYATAKDGKYPINVYIAITRDGEFELSHIPSEFIIPHELPKDANGKVIPSARPANTTFHYAETTKYGASGTGSIFDGDRYKLWPKEMGGDGYYHVFDAAKYGSTGGYGPVLYAAVNAATRFLEGQNGPVPFTQIEYSGNKALTVSNGTENYKMFIEGWSTLNHMDADPINGRNGYFCTRYCPCRLAGTCTSAQMGLENGTCETDCPNCDIGCRNLPREAIGKEGYKEFCNSEGMAPVTQELKEFLQKFSISQLLFMDGQGYVETHPLYSIFATEDDQWLFACGYYE